MAALSRKDLNPKISSFLSFIGQVSPMVHRFFLRQGIYSPGYEGKQGVGTAREERLNG